MDFAHAAARVYAGKEGEHLVRMQGGGEDEGLNIPHWARTDGRPVHSGEHGGRGVPARGALHHPQKRLPVLVGALLELDSVGCVCGEREEAWMWCIHQSSPPQTLTHTSFFPHLPPHVRPSPPHPLPENTHTRLLLLLHSISPTVRTDTHVGGECLLTCAASVPQHCAQRRSSCKGTVHR